MKHYVVGIDLGTTNTVVAYASVTPGQEGICLLQIAQLVAPGQISATPLLPSVRYHGAPGELAPADIALPWDQPASAKPADGNHLPEGPVAAEEGPTVVLGHLARKFGAQVPGRLVVSAKSWLSHAGVDRTAPILPWGAPEGVPKVSPVAASASYLAYVHQCWNRQFPEHPLEQQDVVLTVPASFDEGARQLTMAAAREAGLLELRLLEEPQAVLYDWLFRHRQSLALDLAQTHLVLVCDVGGGTTDLSLIQVQVQDGEPILTRIGVGDHLMLGGDNMDLALAHLVEARFDPAAATDGSSAPARLSSGAWSQLMERCRAVKELLLSPDAPAQAALTLLGTGARLVKSARSVELLQGEVETLIVDGFFPMVARDDLASRGRSGIVGAGLPYARDPAITRHIASFLQRQGTVRDGNDALPETLVPDTLLLNGGVFRSSALVRRVGDTLAAWRGAPLRILDNDDTDVAVARGAVAYALAGRGHAPAIAGGAARSYFLVLDGDGDRAAAGGAERAICVLARASAIGQEVVLGDRTFALRIGQPVRFHLVSSNAGHIPQVGDVIDLNDENLVHLPPIAMVLQADPGGAAVAGAGKRQIRVHLASTLTELGTLQMHCIEADATADSDEKREPVARRWLLQFQLQGDGSGAQGQPQHSAAPVPGLTQAIDKIERIFGARAQQVETRDVKQLRLQLEQLLGSRERWSTPLLRQLFDALLARARGRRRSSEHERVWLNLAGYCLRPGFGAPLDDWRVGELWPLFESGIQYGNDSAVCAEWWTLWRRVTGGLDRPAQLRLLADFACNVQGGGDAAATLVNGSFDDMLRLCGALERIPSDYKVEIGTWLLDQLPQPDGARGQPPSQQSGKQTGKSPHDEQGKRAVQAARVLWALGRLGARLPFHGNAEDVVPPAVAAKWIETLLALDWKRIDAAPFACAHIARMSGDRARDVAPQLRERLIARLKASAASPGWVLMVQQVVQLDADDERRMLGEALPPGLTLII
jgi:molecular chaperone DnaK (HSP70)